MRYLLLASALLLQGCFWRSHETPAEVTTKAGQVDQYADKNDLVMSRAAASIIVASEANKQGLTSVVSNELDIAQSYLPRPTAEDEAYARSRALKADPKAYAKAKAVADSHQRQLDDLWSKVEAEKQKAKDQLEAKEQELKAAEKSQRNIIIIGVGSFLILAGVAMIMFGASKKNAGIGIGIGTAIVTLPQYMDSAHFIWVVSGITVTTVALILIFNWHRLTSNEETNTKA
jgi:lipopolysaccharide export LptBFGC system permease protein LptF